MLPQKREVPCNRVAMAVRNLVNQRPMEGQRAVGRGYQQIAIRLQMQVIGPAKA